MAWRGLTTHDGKPLGDADMWRHGPLDLPGPIAMQVFRKILDTERRLNSLDYWMVGKSDQKIAQHTNSRTTEELRT